MAQINGLALVPVFHRYTFELMPVVAHGVVNLYGDGTRFSVHGGDRGLQRGHALDVVVLIE